MVSDFLSSGHPVVWLVFGVLAIVAIRFTWLLLCGLLKASAFVAMAYLLVQGALIYNSEQDETPFADRLVKKAAYTLPVLEAWKGQVTEELNRYEIKFVVREKDSTRIDKTQRF